MEALQTSPPEFAEIDRIVSQRKGQHGELLGILEEAQRINAFKYLPEETLNRISMQTGVPLARIYNVVTFFSFFNLTPQGRHTITVCRGTACHTKGSRSLLGDIGLVLGCSKGLEDAEGAYTTPDNQFTINTVACFGQCAQAPVIAVDEVIHSSVTTAKLQKLLAKVSRGKEKS